MSFTDSGWNVPPLTWGMGMRRVVEVGWMSESNFGGVKVLASTLLGPPGEPACTVEGEWERGGERGREGEGRGRVVKRPVLQDDQS